MPLFRSFHFQVNAYMYISDWKKVDILFVLRRSISTENKLFYRM